MPKPRIYWCIYSKEWYCEYDPIDENDLNFQFLGVGDTPVAAYEDWLELNTEYGQA